MERLTLQMPAKINLSLDVVGKQENGYHLLRMLMQTVSLHDTLNVRLLPKNDGIRFASNAKFLPSDRRNLAVEAAYRFLESAHADAGAEISLVKRIPVAAGLAGGSTDAAGVLLALNRLTGGPFSADALAALALTMGADIPYCLRGGSALAEGIGEKLTQLPALPGCRIVLCKPAVSVSTAAVFSRLQYKKLTCHPDTAGLLAALDSRSLSGVAQRMYNVLEDITVRLCPLISDIRGQFLEYGALGTVMSGSGPTVFGVFDDHDAARAVCSVLDGTYGSAFVTEPVSGPLIEEN